ncbi:hypothetical protein HHK36_018190 [Tetracentron sinense]|uniref:Ubiquitin-like domain-containing protein n=1 Tax=Tetracentron sinense TaxID=13715 RepID=A0A834Z104_TETSI|nr:hypothetical protein HHK36_018190 [Tetracentron sinense]
MIEVVLNDRLGKKVRVKCNDDDTIGDLKKLVAAQTGTRADKIRIQKWYNIYKDHITLKDYEIHDGMGPVTPSMVLTEDEEVSGRIKLFDLHGLDLKEVALVKIIEKGWKGGLNILWLPEEATNSLAKILGECLQGKQSYMSRKFGGTRGTIIGERSKRQRGVFGHTVILDLRELTDDWEVSRIINKVLPQEENVMLFPFEAHQGIYHNSHEQVISLYNVMQQLMSSNGIIELVQLPLVVAGSKRRRALQTSMGGFERDTISLMGPRRSRLLGKIGALCGGLVEVHPFRVTLSDLSFAKIRVRGDLNLIPRVISTGFYSISYPVEISNWEIELCENCKLWPESMEVRIAGAGLRLQEILRESGNQVDQVTWIIRTNRIPVFQIQIWVERRPNNTRFGGKILSWAARAL